MMQLSLINITIQKTNPNAPLRTNFTADTISKLVNLGIMIDSLEKYNKAIAYATKVCITNLKRKGMIPHSAAKIVKGVIELSKKVMLNPQLYQDIDDLETENVFLTATDLHSVGIREAILSMQQ